MNIRKYDRKDNEKLVNLYNKCFNKKCDKINLTPSGDIFVIEIDSEIIGMGSIDILNDMFKDVKYGYLNNICVDPDYQGKGYGNMIVRELEKYAIYNSCEYLMLTSNKNRSIAHKLYLKNGYEIVDTCIFKKNIK